MEKAKRGLIFFSIFIFTGNTLCSLAQAQDDIYRIEHTDVFGELRRPAIVFAHQAHVDALEDKGCGACHHTPDENTGKLIYVEDEEVSCVECHGKTPEKNAPALREAFHGSCNLCHRRMSNSIKNFRGPTTCGECHSTE